MEWRLAQGTVRGVDQEVGTPLVFVHGTPTWSYEFRHLIAAFAPTMRCLAYDHLGFGRSDLAAADFPYTPEAHAAVFAAWMAQVAPGPAYFVLHDFGGPIALDWLLAHPGQVLGVVVLNSFAWPVDDDPKMGRAARFAGGALSRLLYRRANASLRLLMPSVYGDRKKLTRAIHREYLDVFKTPERRDKVLFPLAKSLSASRAYFASLWARRAALADVPALVVWGEKDRAFPPAFAAKWREIFPLAAGLTLAGAGHWPHEEEPDAVAQAMRRFLELTPRAGPPPPP